MTYQPKHRAAIETVRIPPSLGYQEWIVSEGAGTTAVAPGPDWIIEGTEAWNGSMRSVAEVATANIAAIQMFKEAYATTFWEDYSESRAGHEWDGRSWFA